MEESAPSFQAATVHVAIVPDDRAVKQAVETLDRQLEVAAVAFRDRLVRAIESEEVKRAVAAVGDSLASSINAGISKTAEASPGLEPPKMDMLSTMLSRESESILREIKTAMDDILARMEGGNDA